MIVFFWAQPVPPVLWGWSLLALNVKGKPEWHMWFCGESLTWKLDDNMEKIKKTSAIHVYVHDVSFFCWNILKG